MKNPSREKPAIHPCNLDDIRDRLRALSQQFLLTAEDWHLAGPDLQNERRTASEALATIFNSKTSAFKSGLTALGRYLVHELRGRVAIITNAISLIGRLEKGPDRAQIVEMVCRNLNELAAIIVTIRNNAALETHSICPVLTTTLENLSMLTQPATARVS